MPRSPFLLDDDHHDQASSYEVDIVIDDVRYVYGFEVSPRGIEREWLQDLPRSRWRTLIDRDASRSGKEISLMRGLRDLGGITRRELALSRAILLEHETLAPIGRALAEGIEIAPVGDEHRERRLNSITESLTSGSTSFEDIATLLRIADTGIESVTVREEETPPEALRIVTAIKKAINEADSLTEETGEGSGRTKLLFSPEESDAMMRILEFTHRGTSRNTQSFRIRDESDGTIAWLSTIVPAIEVLRRGAVLCADELDASLHPHLVALLINIFQDERSNPRGAQLIFTSHDMFLLSPLSEVDLAAEQIWFTEKENDGATDLFSLAAFPHPKDANIAKRYLEGRYGAIPRTAPSLFRRFVESEQ